LVGDAGENMTDHARGGNDVLVANGGDVAPLFMFGDAQGEMSDNAIGGNDILTVTGISPLPETLCGDAEVMSGNARGGDDVLQTDGDILSGANGAVLYGDAYSMSGNARGGSDRLIGGIAGTSDTLIGDAYEMHGNAKAGNDVLISGGANDQMWGDAVVIDSTVTRGDNTFVFAPMNGHDTINDFHPGNDHIDLTADAAIGIHRFADLNIQTVGADSIIHIDAGNDVTVVGVNHLNASDFIFDEFTANKFAKPVSLNEGQVGGAYDGSGGLLAPTGRDATSVTLLCQYAAAGFQCEANNGGSLFSTSQQVAGPNDEQCLAQPHR
jgi:serralysin